MKYLQDDLKDKLFDLLTNTNGFNLKREDIQFSIPPKTGSSVTFPPPSPLSWQKKEKQNPFIIGNKIIDKNWGYI